ncbi:glycosyltransferase family 4 protein [Candidatus Woesearchaeota archaeon]|nr:glycosyltransferase family 4 protein [Candidatus Woesearchaeota archaeon]
MSNKLRVLFVSEYFPPHTKGGGEISAYLLAKSLAKKIEVHVLTSGENDNGTDDITIHRELKTGEKPDSLASNFRRLFFRSSVRARVKSFADKNKPNILHCLNSTSLIGTVDARTNTKVVCHVNSPLFFCPKANLIRYKKKNGTACDLKRCGFQSFLKCFLKSPEFGKVKNRFYLKYNPFIQFYLWVNYNRYQKYINKVDHFIAVSSFMKQKLISSGVNENKISVIPNIIDLSKFKKKKEKSERTRILFLGAYTEAKGAILLLQALTGVKDYRANFYGDGQLKKELSNFVEENHMPVIINGKVPGSKIPQIFAEHDIIVIPSIVPEAFGRNIIEAAASGTPYICSDIPAFLETSKKGAGGLVFRTGDVKDLAKKLNSLVNDKPLYNKKQKEAAMLEKGYKAEKIAGKVIKTYKELLK